MGPGCLCTLNGVAVPPICQSVQHVPAGKRSPRGHQGGGLPEPSHPAGANSSHDCERDTKGFSRARES